MATKTKPLVATEPFAAAANGLARGYLPAARPRYRWVTYEQSDTEADPDGEPFRAEIRVNLTWGEIDEIDIAGGLTYQELWQRMAPHIQAWNALGQDTATGEIVPVPPPMTAGPDAFSALEPAITMWLAVELKTSHLGGEERGKGSAPPAPSVDPPAGEG